MKTQKPEHKQGQRETNASLDLNRLPWYVSLKGRKAGNWEGKPAGALENGEREDKRGGQAHIRSGAPTG